MRAISKPQLKLAAITQEEYLENQMLGAYGTGEDYVDPKSRSDWKGFVEESPSKKPKMVKKKCYACGGQGTVPGSWKSCPTCSGTGKIESEAIPAPCPGCGVKVTTKSGWCPECNQQRRDHRFGTMLKVSRILKADAANIEELTALVYQKRAEYEAIRKDLKVPFVKYTGAFPQQSDPALEAMFSDPASHEGEIRGVWSSMGGKWKGVSGYSFESWVKNQFTVENSDMHSNTVADAAEFERARQQGRIPQWRVDYGKYDEAMRKKDEYMEIYQRIQALEKALGTVDRARETAQRTQKSIESAKYSEYINAASRLKEEKNKLVLQRIQQYQAELDAAGGPDVGELQNEETMGRGIDGLLGVLDYDRATYVYEVIDAKFDWDEGNIEGMELVLHIWKGPGTPEEQEQAGWDWTEANKGKPDFIYDDTSKEWGGHPTPIPVEYKGVVNDIFDTLNSKAEDEEEPDWRDGDY